METQIYSIRPSCEDERPYINHELHVNAKNELLTVGCILKGELPGDCFPDIRFVVNRKDATAWDCYREPGTFGLYSEKAAQVLFTHHDLQCFTLFPALLNDVTYYFARCDKCLDALNAVHSEFRYLGSGQNRFIAEIVRHIFTASSIPERCAFCIPQTKSDLYCTQALIRDAERSGIKGLYAELVYPKKEGK